MTLHEDARMDGSTMRVCIRLRGGNPVILIFMPWPPMELGRARQTQSHSRLRNAPLSIHLQ